MESKNHEIHVGIDIIMHYMVQNLLIFEEISKKCTPSMCHVLVDNLTGTKHEEIDRLLVNFFKPLLSRVRILG